MHTVKCLQLCLCFKRERSRRLCAYVITVNTTLTHTESGLCQTAYGMRSFTPAVAGLPPPDQSQSSPHTHDQLPGEDGFNIFPQINLLFTKTKHRGEGNNRKNKENGRGCQREREQFSQHPLGEEQPNQSRTSNGLNCTDWNPVTHRRNKRWRSVSVQTQTRVAPKQSAAKRSEFRLIAEEMWRCEWQTNDNNNKSATNTGSLEMLHVNRDGTDSAAPGQQLF